MASLEQWIKDFPVITRTYMAGALLTTAACALELLSPYSLYFSLPLIVNKHQYYRLVTNFFFFGRNFTLDFLFHMFFLVRYCRALEEGSFRGRTADFFFLILFGATLMTLIAPLVSLQFLGSSLTFMMVYIWARRNPFARMNFLGLFTFTAPYLPWVLLAFSFVLGNNGVVDVVGIAVGHLYYFLEDVYPLMLPSRKRLLATPRLVQLLFSNPTDEQPHTQEQMPHIIHEEQINEQINMQHADMQQQQQQQQQGRREEAAPVRDLEGADVVSADHIAEHSAEEASVDGVLHEVGDAEEVDPANDSTGVRRRTTTADRDQAVEAARQPPG